MTIKNFRKLSLILISISGLNLYSQVDPDILPEHVLAFPFGSEDYRQKITSDQEKATIWSEEKIMAWAKGQGFTVTTDQPDGGYQFRRGIVFHPPGLGFNLSTHLSPRGDQQRYGWKLVLDFGVFYPTPFEETLSTDFKYYENIIRYEIWIDNIYFQTVEMGYGITMKTPLVINIPYIRDDSGQVRIELRMKNHPDNFGILYDAYLTL